MEKKKGAILCVGMIVVGVVGVGVETWRVVRNKTLTGILRPAQPSHRSSHHPPSRAISITIVGKESTYECFLLHPRTSLGYKGSITHIKTTFNTSECNHTSLGVLVGWILSPS